MSYEFDSAALTSATIEYLHDNFSYTDWGLVVDVVEYLQATCEESEENFFTNLKCIFKELDNQDIQKIKIAYTENKKFM